MIYMNVSVLNTIKHVTVHVYRVRVVENQKYVTAIPVTSVKPVSEPYYKGIAKYVLKQT